jgi:uncharacterized protein YcbK (DUF882 family)
VRSLSIALLVVFLAAPRPGAAQAVDEPVEGEMAGPGGHLQAPKPQKRKKGRRARFQGKAVAENDLRPEPFPHPSGTVHLYSPNSREEVEVNIYNPDGAFNEESLKALSHLLRCKRTDTEKPIEPHLFEILSAIQDHFDGHRLQVISGFRNQRKVTSFHFHGTAADIRVDGVPERRVRDFAASLDSGGMGVGIYPNAHFVHVDVRPWPSFRWTDYSHSGDASSGRLPPRGFKKKQNPQS